MEDKKKIDELFNKRFRGYEAEPPADAWSNIEQRLESRERKKRIAYWRYAGTAAAVVLAFFTGYFFNPNADDASQYLKKTGRPSQELLKDGPGTEEPRGNRPEKQGSNTDQASPKSSEQPETRVSNGALTAVEEKQPARNSRSARPAEEMTDLPLKENAGRQVVETEVPAGKNVLDQDGFFATELKSSISKEAGEAYGDIAFEDARDKNPQLEDPDKNEEKTPAETNELSATEDHTALLTNAELKNTENESSRRGVSLGLMASPTFAFRDVQVQERAAGMLQQNVDNEKLVNSYAAGVDLAFRGGSKLEFQAGLYINHWEQYSEQLMLGGTSQRGFSGAVAESNGFANTSTGYVSIGNANDETDMAALPGQDSTLAFALVPGVQQQYQFVEIPLTVGYYLLESESWGWKIRGGLTPRLLTGSQASLTYPDGSEKSMEESGINPLSLQVLAGTGVEYRLNKHLRINLSPSLQYGITPINNSSQVNTYFHQALIFSGVSWKF